MWTELLTLEFDRLLNKNKNKNTPTLNDMTIRCPCPKCGMLGLDLKVVIKKKYTAILSPRGSKTCPSCRKALNSIFIDDLNTACVMATTTYYHTRWMKLRK